MGSMPTQQPGRSRQDYETPPLFIEAVKRLLNIDGFTLDLAADAFNTKAEHYYTEEMDALVQPWHEDYRVIGGGWCWLNPPFANIAPWAEKCWKEGWQGCRIAMLVPAGVGANWFRDGVHGKAAYVYFLNGRLSFDGIAPYPKDCVLALYGSEDSLRSLYTIYQVWSWASGKDPA